MGLKGRFKNNFPFSRKEDKRNSINNSSVVALKSSTGCHCSFQLALEVEQFSVMSRPWDTKSNRLHVTRNNSISPHAEVRSF